MNSQMNSQMNGQMNSEMNSQINRQLRSALWGYFYRENERKILIFIGMEGSTSNMNITCMRTVLASVDNTVVHEIVYGLVRVHVCV